MSVNVKVKLFAAARELAGCESVELDLPEGAQVSDLRAELSGRFPDLAPLLQSAAFAIDAEYARDEAALSADQEIACIPPVSGG